MPSRGSSSRTDKQQRHGSILARERRTKKMSILNLPALPILKLDGQVLPQHTQSTPGKVKQLGPTHAMSHPTQTPRINPQ